MPTEKDKKEIGENAQISTSSFLNKTNITNNHGNLLHLGKYSSISYLWESQDVSSLACARCGGNKLSVDIFHAVCLSCF